MNSAIPSTSPTGRFSGSADKVAHWTVTVGRVFLALALLTLLGAWVAAWRAGPVFGFGEEHLFRDATVLALLGIGFLLDATLHRERS